MSLTNLANLKNSPHDDRALETEKEMAYYMETYFNNMYSLKPNVPINFKPVMPKVIPETASFGSSLGYENRSIDLSESGKSISGTPKISLK